MNWPPVILLKGKACSFGDKIVFQVSSKLQNIQYKTENASSIDSGILGFCWQPACTSSILFYMHILEPRVCIAAFQFSQINVGL